MDSVKPRLGWLPLVQLTAAVILLAAGVWQTSAIRLQDKLMRTQAANQAQFVANLPPPPPKYSFPAGGQQLFPDYRLVALYGTPGAPVLGALGQQNLQASIKRVKGLAAQYQVYSKQHILPTFEIIATVASAYPTSDNDYSQEVSTKTIQTWVNAARHSGVYVVLDLQSGRSDFLTQAKRLAPLLSQPNVGLALDPEWRLTPTEVPLVQIGRVSINEVNATAAWLAQLSSSYRLPQKLFLLHEFRMTSLPNRNQLDTSHPQLAYAIQMDGQGPQSEKQKTWREVTALPPTHVHFGWKNFYHKDPVVLTPAQTMAIRPQPWYISYQ